MTEHIASRPKSILGKSRSNVSSLVCAFLASATTGGTIYAFGVYGDALKKALNLSQLQLDAISAAFFIAGLFSWIPGIVVDRMKMRFSMCLGGSSGAVFTTMYWVVCRETLFSVSHPVTVLSVLAVLICLSCGLIIGSVFKLTMLYSGREGKGPAVGIAKGFVGLGSGIYATIFQAFRASDESALDFLPVIAFFFIVCAALPAWLLLPTKEQADPHLMNIETSPHHFRTMYISLLVLCIFIVGSSLTDILNETNANTDRNYGKVALILILWLGPIISLLYLPRKGEELPSVFVKSNTEDESSSQTETLSDSVTSPGEQSEEDASDEETSEEETNLLLNNWRAIQEEDETVRALQSYQNSPRPKEKRNVEVDLRADLSLPEMLRTPSAWLLLWTSTVLVGSGTSKTNNMGQMVESLGFPEAVTPATLAIFSVAQAASRVVTGVASEAALNRKLCTVRSDRGVPRPFFLAIASTVALLAQLVLATSTGLAPFVVGCALSGLAFGMAWPLMVLIVGDVFGVEHHGANYMFYDGGTKALGTLLLSECLAGSVYEAHVPDGDDALTCFGPACFRMTHVAVAGLALTGVAASFALQFTTRQTYSKRLLHA